MKRLRTGGGTPAPASSHAPAGLRFRCTGRFLGLAFLGLIHASSYLVVSLPDLRCDLGPEVLLFDSLLRALDNCRSHLRVGEQHSQHVRQVVNISRPEGEPGIFDHFTILWNITRKDTNARTHGVQQRQRKSFQIGWQGEQSRMGQQFV